jgi:hypothetical protein
MDDEDRAWSRLQRNLVIGAAVGAIVGVVVGLIIGAIVFQRPGAIAASAIAGAIGIGGIGAFWGLLSALESPDPGNEPGQAENPIRDVPELTREEQPLRHVSSDPDTRRRDGG